LADFFYQIESVKILQETENILYLVLPVCHLGCQVSPVVEHFSNSPNCPICGMFRGQCTNSTRKFVNDRPEISRKEIEKNLITKAKNEPEFKEKLLNQGKPVIIDILKQWELDIPDFLINIQEFKVLEETPHLLYMVLPWQTKREKPKV
jgi:hypothetical protein